MYFLVTEKAEMPEERQSSQNGQVEDHGGFHQTGKVKNRRASRKREYGTYSGNGCTATSP